MTGSLMTGPSFTDQPINAPPVLAPQVSNYQACKGCHWAGGFHQPKSLEVYANNLYFLVESMIAPSSMRFEHSLCTLPRTLQVDPNLWCNICIRKLRTQ